MSLSSKITIDCPKCHTKGQCTVYETINGTLHPELREALLSGNSLTSYTCEHCGAQANIEAPLMYHDMTHHFMIWYHPQDDIQTDLATIVGSPEIMKVLTSKGYRFRRVLTLQELRDKIIQMESPYPDYALEWCKVIYGGLLMEQAPINEDIHTSAYTIKDGDLICVFPLQEKGQVATLSVKGNQMDVLMETCPLQEPSRDTIHHVNVDWAIAESNRLQGEGTH